MAFSPTPQHGEGGNGLFPMIEVLNPQDGSPAVQHTFSVHGDPVTYSRMAPRPIRRGWACFRHMPS